MSGMTGRAAKPLAVAGALAAGGAAVALVGREQRRRLVRLAGRAGRSVPVAETAGFVGGKAAAASHLTLEWVKDLAGKALGWRDADEAADALAVDLAEELAQAINEHAYQVTRAAHHGTSTRRSARTAAGGRRRPLVQASSR